LLLSLLSCVTTAVGIALALQLRENRRAITAGMGFSVGIMVLISTVELIPEAIAAMGAGPTITSVALGVALLWVAHLVIPHTHLLQRRMLAYLFRAFEADTRKGKVKETAGKGIDNPKLERVLNR